MPVDVLAIAAHPDDVEMTCAGTLVRLRATGKSFGIVDLTRGEMVFEALEGRFDGLNQISR